MKIKKFYEAEEYIYGNPGIPGQSGDPGEPDYLRNAASRRNQQLRQQGPGSFDLHMASRITRGKERELEELATKVFNNIYRGLIDRYKITFDIKFSNTREIGNMIEVNENLEHEKYKRKIINLVSQGESKNMMGVIHSQEVKDGVCEIFGEKQGNELISIWSDIVKAVDNIDNNRNLNARWSTSYVKNTIEGAVKVTWTKNDDLNEANEDDDVDDEEFFEDPEDDWENKFVNALNTSDQETLDEIISEKNLPPGYIKGHYRPVIVARGTDFCLLIHEAIKGLYTTLAMGGIPKDMELARQILNKGNAIKEEPEEFKWGPTIAADLRDFLNESPNMDAHPNIREEFWIYIMKLPTEEFLSLINGMLSNKPETRTKVNVLLKEVIKGIEKFISHRDYKIKLKKYREDMRKFNQEMADYEQKLLDIEEEKRKNRMAAPVPEPEVEEPGEIDYSTLSQRELQELQNDAIDSSDWATAQKIAEYIR